MGELKKNQGIKMLVSALNTADLVFFDAHPKSIKQNIIKLITGNPIHVGVVLKTAKETLLIHASKEAGRIVLEDINRYINYGAIMRVYRVKREYIKKVNTSRLVIELAEFIGKKYGFLTYVTALLSYCLKLSPEVLGHGDYHYYNPHCAALVSRAFRNAGLDLRPDISDVLTTPKDLIESTFLEYVGRLY